MKKLLTLACSIAALTFPGIAQADTEGISYDFFEAGWSFNSLDNFDDSHGGSLAVQVSIADNAYIKLFGTISSDASDAGFGIGLHHEVVESVDLYAEVGGFYEDVVDDFGPYGELGARWLTCKWFELDAGVGLEYIESDTDFYGIVRAIVPFYKGLAFVGSAKIEDHGQTYGAGFRLNF